MTILFAMVVLTAVLFGAMANLRARPTAWMVLFVVLGGVWAITMWMVVGYLAIPRHAVQNAETRNREASARLHAIGEDYKPAIPPKAAIEDAAMENAPQTEAESPSGELAESPVNTKLPAWVNEPPQRRDDAYFVTVRSGEIYDPAMRETALDVKMVAAAGRYIDEMLYRNQPGVAEVVKIDADYLREHCIASESTPADNGGDESFVQLKFDPKFRQEVERRYLQYISLSRVEQLGGITVGVLGVLAAALAYLRFTKPRT